jgi:hypothetical protein
LLLFQKQSQLIPFGLTFVLLASIASPPLLFVNAFVLRQLEAWCFDESKLITCMGRAGLRLATCQDHCNHEGRYRQNGDPYF